MSIAKLQAFIGYLRTHKIMKQTDIVRVVRQMVQLDRRVGLLANMRGYMDANSINTILHESTASTMRFGEIAVEKGILNKDQVSEVLRLQQDDLFMFSQAAVMQRVLTAPEMVDILKKYTTNEPAVDEPEENEKEKAGMNRHVRKVLQNIKEVAPLPGPVQKILQMLQDPDCDVDKVSKLITLEPTLVTQLLRVCNSAFYGLQSKIETVSQALMVLGFKKIRQLVLTAGVMQKFQNIPPKKAADFWDLSVHSAQWAKEIAMYLKKKEAEELFIAGLIHNIGELVIFQYFLEEYNKIQTLIKAGKTQTQAELAILGGTHADIGGFVCEMWQLSPDVIQGTMFHTQNAAYLKQIKGIADTVVIMNLAVHLAEIDSKLDPYEYIIKAEDVKEEYSEMLELEGFEVDNMIGRVQTAKSDLLKMFK